MNTKHLFEKFATPISIIIAGALIGGGIVLSKMTSLNSTGSASETIEQETTVDKKTIATFINNPNRIVLGNKKAKNVIIEVSDPSCPYCHFAAGLNNDLVTQSGLKQFQTVTEGGNYIAPVPEIKKLIESGDAVLVYTFGNGHGNGELAMQALYCANDQGTFWNVHDKLMTGAGYIMINDIVKNDPKQSTTLTKFLADVSDATAMQSCLDSQKHAANVKRDISENSQLNFAGTPHFIINGKIFRGAVDFTTIKTELK
jgi:protein-disulfide isomerase